MASIGFPTIRNYAKRPTMAASDPKFNPIKDGSLSKSGIFTKKRDIRDLTITNVATTLPPTLTSTGKEVSDERSHAAWKSIQQERWEGELAVEGEIPKWLVC